MIRSALLELFCAPRPSLDNPSFRPSSQQRAFFVHDYGELEVTTGYWAIGEETGQEGLFRSLKTSSGFMVKCQMSGQPAISRVADVLTKVSGKGARTGTRSGTKELVSVSFTRRNTKAKARPKAIPIYQKKGKNKEPFPADWAKWTGKQKTKPKFKKQGQ